jgi:hypothetical protein
MDRRLTRRRALRLGAGALALGAVRSSPALAAPALFELPVPDDGAHAAALWRTTGVLRAPRRFSLVGLRWRGGAVEAQARARRAGGRWTAWTPLPALGGHGPDGGAAAAGTDPAYMGAADELQLRLRGSARGLRAAFVAVPAESQRAGGRALRASRPGDASRRASAAAQVNPPAIIPREGWGGDRVIPREPPLFGEVQAAFVHHTVTAVNYAPEESAGIIVGIARYHRDYNGWNDIGYNFLVDRYGQVFEGRAGGIENAVVGAQAQGWNSYSTGIACLGTFTSAKLPEAAFDALARLIGWKLSLHGVPVLGQVTLVSQGGASNRYRSGRPILFNRVNGHRDGDQTSCPGDALYRQLPALRTRANGYAGPVSGITVTTSSRQRGSRPVELAGSLHFADGSSPAGATLAIEYTTAGAAWTPVASTLCADDGSWATSAVLPSSGAVRAVFAGDATRGRVVSGRIPVTVVPLLSLTSNVRRTTVGGTIAVSGTLAPEQKHVDLVLERKVGRRWVLVIRRRRLAVTGGRYASTVRLNRPGLYRVWIKAAGANRSRQLRAIA